jgi:hypothetical protein
MNRTFYMTPEQAKEYGIIDRVLTTQKSWFDFPDLLWENTPGRLIRA